MLVIRSDGFPYFYFVSSGATTVMALLTLLPAEGLLAAGYILLYDDDLLGPEGDTIFLAAD